MRHILTITMASALAMSAGAALAQQRYPAPQTYEQWQDQQEDYRQEQREYEQARREWERRQADYERRQANYQQRRQDYEARRAQWERDRADYDRRYGYGAYVRRYGEWRYDPNARVDYGYDRGGPGRDRDGYGLDRDGRDYYAGWRHEDCERREDRGQVIGGLFGALAGAAIGSNVVDNEAQTEGTVLGAIVGGAIGANIGEKSAACDTDGYYYTYAQTYEYREPRYRAGSRSGRYDRDWYIRNRCRLAVAPTDYRGRTDYRYVRVCPDRRGRYRITS
ncbi:glycine zipper 2TM domain-containing protein [Caulobacter sp. SLTY]|nr:glycine zipper 2TM domain-containing protein [Caulobacter sp. SLTY]